MQECWWFPISARRQTRGRRPFQQKVLAAKTIFVDNQTNDAELQHDAYMGLRVSGRRFEIVDSPQKADLVLRLSGSSVVKFVPGGEAAATYTAKPVSENSARRRARTAGLHALNTDGSEERKHAMVRRSKDVQRTRKKQITRGTARRGRSTGKAPQQVTDERQPRDC